MKSSTTNFYDVNSARFHEAFTAPKEWFLNLGDFYEPRTGELLVHQDNGKKILIVAHTDFVVPTIPDECVEEAWLKNYGIYEPLPTVSKFGPFTFKNTGKWFPRDNTPRMPKKLDREQEDYLSCEWVVQQAEKHTGPVVDDRLGCALALGCSDWADLLFTDGEELGRSTAAFFQAPRAYNWIIGFDRRGVDVVTYDYKDSDWLTALETNFTIGHGSFSDIGYLEKLGTACVNMGIGYYNEHTTKAHWNPKDTEAQFARLYEFWRQFSDTAFNHIPPIQKESKADLGRHEGKNQNSLHGREWLYDLPQALQQSSKSVYTGGWHNPLQGIGTSQIVGVKHPKTQKSKKKSKQAVLVDSRYSPTGIKETAFDNFVGDYVGLEDLDLEDAEVKDFILEFYPDFMDNLRMWTEENAFATRDEPLDPYLTNWSFLK